MKIKKIIVFTLVVCFLGMFAACDSSTESATEESAADTTIVEDTTDDAAESDEVSEEEKQTYTLKFGHQMAVGHSTDVAVNNWAELVEEASDGRIIIDIYPANQLGSIQEMQEACRLGTLDICLGDPSMLSNLQPEYGLLALPFIFDGYESAAAVYDGEVGQALAELLATENNMRPLGFFWNGMRCFVTKDPLISLADCENYKLRSPEAQIYLDTFTLLGMNPTPVAWADVYTSIQTGVVNGTDTTPESVLNLEFHKIAPYINASNHMLSTIGPCINEDVWQSMSEEDQQILIDCFAIVLEEQREGAVSLDAEIYEELEADDATITEFSDKEEIVEIFTSYWTEYATENDCLDLLEKIIAVR